MDLKLLRGLEDGDRDAHNTLIREYYPRLMGYASMLLDDEDARDIVQETFLYIWENRARIRFAQGFQSYLFRTCHSRMLDFLKRRRPLCAGVDPQALQLRAEISWLEQNSEDIVGTICNKDLMQRVMDMTGELPNKRREVFRLSMLHDMTNAEIAELLRIPQRTVEGHLYHALRFLRARLGREELLALMAAITLID